MSAMSKFPRLASTSRPGTPAAVFPAPPPASGDLHDAIIQGIERLRRSKEFKRAGKLLDDGVDSAGAFDEVRRALQAMAKASTGALGP